MFSDDISFEEQRFELYNQHIYGDHYSDYSSPSFVNNLRVNV